jgi:sugar phosphate isomerase/epimerase
MNHLTGQPRGLSLHHLSMMELPPEALVRTAGAAGFQHVCIFTQAMPGLPFPLVTQTNQAVFRAALRDTGVTVYNLEIFPLGLDDTPECYLPALELGAALGGTRATALIVNDDDPGDARAIDQFGRFCDMAGKFGIDAGLEFMAFTSVKTIDHAMRIVRGAGRPNGTLAVDALHLMRNGAGPADFDRLAVKKSEIGYIQLCDGAAVVDAADAFDEATANRTPPGHGVFPLGDFLAHLPETHILSLECPLERMRAAGMDALARARLLHDSTREVLRRFAPAG